MRRPVLLIAVLATVMAALFFFTWRTLARPNDEVSTFLPVIQNPETPYMVEFRGLWVSRFDWTSYNQPADPAVIDEIVTDAAAAGFNAILFQVRGSADAYYQPGPEPWARRVSGDVVGQPPNPLWDPLAYFIEKAHEQGLALHAYINVYPVWDECDNAPPITTPEHFYHALEQEHGASESQLNGLQWDNNGDIHCSVYQRATPASVFADTHYLTVTQYLIDNYDIDGIHLDNIRYGGSTASCDPVSAARAGVPCFSDPPDGYDSYEEWQRVQVNGTVGKFYDQILAERPELWLTAAVWPIYIERPEWGWGGFAQEGYHDYYQDSKAWVQGGYIDSISPMIYPGTYNCPDNSFWSLERWQVLVADFQADSGDRYTIPGIGTGYCSFDEISSRIAAARDIGTPGHALFSYSGLKANDYFDDLANGPYALPAVLPELPRGE